MYAYIVVGQHVNTASTTGIPSDVTSVTCDSEVLIQS